MRCYVSGNVQGVFYRVSTQVEAKKYGITGWAKNLADGRVEVVACGSSEHLDLFFAWLKQGPKNAKVLEVTRESIIFTNCQGFVVL